MIWEDEVLAIHECVLKKWAPYSPEDARFLALALSGEVGELANLVKKEWRGDLDGGNLRSTRSLDDERMEWQNNVREELADVRIYLELLGRALGVDLDAACEEKVVELRRRWPETGAGSRPAP